MTSLALTLADSPDEVRPRSRFRFLLTLVALAAILVGYGWMLQRNFVPAISEPDDNGYFAQGTLIAQTGHTWFKAQSDAQFIGMHWLVVPGQTYISRYPPGLAVIIAGVYKLFGYKASLWVNPALSIAALIAMFFLCRRLVSSMWALVATAILAFNPQFAHHALSGDSHIAVTAFLTWCLYFLVRWSQTPRLLFALLAGFFFGVIPTVRYPDSVMALGVGLFLLAPLRRVPGIWKHYLLFIVGAAVPVTPLLIRNQLLLGAFWRTGYALTNEQTGFSWAYFREHALGYIQLLHSGGVGLLFALGVIGIVVMICLRGSRPLGIMLALICLPMLLLYMAYYWAPKMNSGMTMRFLLPTFPAYVLAGVWLLATVLKEMPRAARVAVPMTLLAAQGLWGTGDLLEQMQRMRFQKEPFARVTDRLDAISQPGDLVVANNQILQHLDFVRKWKLSDPSIVRGGGSGPDGPGGPGQGAGGGGGAGRFGPEDDPDAPSPMQREKRLEQQEKYAGTRDQREDKFAADLLRWADGHKVYLIGSESEVREGMSPRTGDINIVARVQLPDPPAEESRGGLRGGAGGQRGGPGGPGMAGGRGGMGGFSPQGMSGPGMRGPRGGAAGGGFPGAGFGGARGGMPGGRGFAGAGGGFPGGPGMSSGPGMNGGGERELVIAEWLPPRRNAAVSSTSDDAKMK